MLKYYDLPVIDAHWHIKDEFSKDLKEILEAMRDIHTNNNLQACNILSVPSWDDSNILQNLICILYKALHNSDTFAFGGLDYHLPGLNKETFDFCGQCEKLMKMGFDGIKFIESKPIVRKTIGDIPYSAELYDGLFEYLEGKKIPILWHVADPEYFWNADLIPEWAVKVGMFYGSGQYPKKEEFYLEVEEILNKHPGLKIIFAHMYFFSADLERADRFLSKWPNISFDITPGVDTYEDFYNRTSDWRDFFIKYQDRIVFGTDSGWDSDQSLSVMVEFSKQKSDWIRKFLESSEEFDMFDIRTRGIGLQRDVLEKIYCTNFIRFAGVNSKKVDVPKIVSYCKYIKGLIEDSTQINFKKELLERIKFIEDELPNINH